MQENKIYTTNLYMYCSDLQHNMNKKVGKKKENNKEDHYFLVSHKANKHVLTKLDSLHPSTCLAYTSPRGSKCMLVKHTSGVFISAENPGPTFKSTFSPSLTLQSKH